MRAREDFLFSFYELHFCLHVCLSVWGRDLGSHTRRAGGAESDFSGHGVGKVRRGLLEGSERDG